MIVLEARFHPRSKTGGGAVVIGRVRVLEGRVSVEASPPRAESVRPFDAAGLIAKLRFLVESAGADVSRHLLSLRSDYWSFTEVNDVASPPR
jgi:hypothetical protein